MKRKSLVLTFIIVLLLTVAGEQFVGLGRGNPYHNLNVVYGGHTEAPPNTEPPKITIGNVSNSGKNVSTSFNVRIGESMSSDNVSSMIIASVYYRADWQPKDKLFYEFVPNPPLPSNNNYIPYPNPSNLKTEISGNLSLVEIPEGRHTLTIYATERGSYYNLDPSNWPMFGTVYSYGFNKTSSSSVSFIIDTTPPNVSISSLENKTYTTLDVPLNFVTSEIVSQISYVLDGQKNVTISGNATLPGLPCGVHNVTVYAWDEAGNSGSSETVYFTILEPEPPHPFPTTMITAPIASVAVMGVGFVVYYKKRKNGGERKHA
jgi:hypothetical protein